MNDNDTTLEGIVSKGIEAIKAKASEIVAKINDIVKEAAKTETAPAPGATAETAAGEEAAQAQAPAPTTTAAAQGATASTAAPAPAATPTPTTAAQGATVSTAAPAEAEAGEEAAPAPGAKVEENENENKIAVQGKADLEQMTQSILQQIRSVKTTGEEGKANAIKSIEIAKANAIESIEIAEANAVKKEHVSLAAATLEESTDNPDKNKQTPTVAKVDSGTQSERLEPQSLKSDLETVTATQPKVPIDMKLSSSLYLIKDSLRDVFASIYDKGTYDDKFFTKTLKNSDMLGTEFKRILPDYSEIPERQELHKMLSELNRLLNEPSNNEDKRVQHLLNIGIVNKFILDKMKKGAFGTPHKHLPKRDEYISLLEFINNTIVQAFSSKQTGGKLESIGTKLMNYYPIFRERRRIFNENSSVSMIPTVTELTKSKGSAAKAENENARPIDTSPIIVDVKMPNSFLNFYTKRQGIAPNFKITDMNSIYFLYHGDKEQFALYCTENGIENEQLTSVETTIKTKKADMTSLLASDEATVYFYQPTVKEIIIKHVVDNIDHKIRKHHETLTAHQLYSVQKQNDTDSEEQVKSEKMTEQDVQNVVADVQSRLGFRSEEEMKKDLEKCPPQTCPQQTCSTAQVIAGVADSSSKFLKYEIDPDVLQELIKMIADHKEKVTLMESSTLIPEMRTKLKAAEVKMRANKPADEKTVSEKHVRAIKRGFNDILSCVKDAASRYYSVNVEFLMDIRKRIKYMEWWEEEMRRRIALENSFVELGSKIKQSGGSLEKRYKEHFDNITKIKNDLLATGAFCIRFFSKQIRESIATGLGSIANDLSKLPEDEDKNYFVKKREALLKYIDTLERKIFSMYSIKYSIMDIILDKRFMGLYVFKLITYGILVGSIFFAEKIFSEMYMKQVYAQNKDAPSLLNFYGIFLGLFIGFNLFLLTVMFLLMYVFKTPSNDFLISGDFIIRFLADLGIYTVLLSLLAIIIGSILEKKRYFRYKTEGLRCIRAYREIMIGIAAIMVIIPYFSFV